MNHESGASISADLFNYASEIESLEQEIVRLKLHMEELKSRRVELMDKRAELRKRLSARQSTVDFANWQRGQHMTMDLLREEVGGDVFDV